MLLPKLTTASFFAPHILKKESAAATVNQHQQCTASGEVSFRPSAVGANNNRGSSTALLEKVSCHRSGNWSKMSVGAQSIMHGRAPSVTILLLSLLLLLIVLCPRLYNWYL
jgi:hypothetical protein